MQRTRNILIGLIHMLSLSSKDLRAAFKNSVQQSTMNILKMHEKLERNRKEIQQRNRIHKEKMEI